MDTIVRRSPSRKERSCGEEEIKSKTARHQNPNMMEDMEDMGGMGGEGGTEAGMGEGVGE